jgi:hypothetical protein
MMSIGTPEEIVQSAAMLIPEISVCPDSVSR